MQSHIFFGINFSKCTYTDCLREVESRLVTQKKTLLVTPNPEMLFDAHSNETLASILKNSDIAIPDGIGVFVGYQIVESGLPRWGKYCMIPYWCLRAILHSKRFSHQYGERITGSRLTPDILALATKNNIGVTILDPVVHGKEPGDIQKRTSQENIESSINKAYPGIECNVVIADGTRDIHQIINPIILATHGAGRQEKIINQILQENPNTLLAIGVGGSIDLLTGFRATAPHIFKRLGGEWLYRLYKNPKKHSKRILRVFRFLELCLNT